MTGWRIRLGGRGPRPGGVRRPAGHGGVAAPQTLTLHVATDGGQPIDVPAEGGTAWQDVAQGFLRHNTAALTALDVEARVEAGTREVRLRLYPGARVGAVPLRSALTGHVRSGLVVRPRFGWAGIGQVLDQTGWLAMPEVLALPLVPGSGREVPPWVIAGPALRRLRELLARLQRGYRIAEEVMPGVRGRVQWTRYAVGHLPRGSWGHFPCRFPDLGHDPRLRAEVRWALERVRHALLAAAGSDRLALRLAEEVLALLSTLADVAPLRPSPSRIPQAMGDAVLEAGLQALAWVAEERGLGGPAELHGLAWVSPLDTLWERFVEGAVRDWATTLGGSVSSARERASWIPIRWEPRGAASMGHLAPDLVMRMGRQAVIVDAKYKAHLAGLDAEGWRAFSEADHAAHRADVHQALAYAASVDADTVTTVLVYPLRAQTWEDLASAGRALMIGELGGGRRVRLALAGLPFGREPSLAARVRASWSKLLAG